MSLLAKLVTTGALYLVTIFTGIWLHRTERPFSTLLVSAHKLIALAGVVFTVLLVFNPLKQAEPKALLWGAVIAAGLGLIALIATGAILSGAKPNRLLLRVHDAATLLAVAGVALSAYLLVWG